MIYHLIVCSINHLLIFYIGCFFFSAFGILSFPEMSVDTLMKAIKSEVPSNFLENSEVNRRLPIEAMYSLPMKRQEQDISQLRKESELQFPTNFNFRE